MVEKPVRLKRRRSESPANAIRATNREYWKRRLAEHNAEQEQCSLMTPEEIATENELQLQRELAAHLELILFGSFCIFNTLMYTLKNTLIVSSRLRPEVNKRCI
ncbi:hypothetical protein BDDG_07377, partial [Blastomyces dermatitidis ATCC 18188]